MLGSLLKSLLSAILLIGFLTGPVPAAFATGMGPTTGAQSMTMADMPGMEMGTMQAGGDCCRTPELPPADCGKACPLVFSCLSQCFVATADDVGLRAWLLQAGVVVWAFRDRHCSRLLAAGPYEPPRA